MVEEEKHYYCKVYSNVVNIVVNFLVLYTIRIYKKESLSK